MSCSPRWENRMIPWKRLSASVESAGSLKEYGVIYRQVDLLEDGSFDYENIRKAINEKTKLITIQRSKGYADPSNLLRRPRSVN